MKLRIARVCQFLLLSVAAVVLVCDVFAFFSDADNIVTFIGKHFSHWTIIGILGAGVIHLAIENANLRNGAKK